MTACFPAAPRGQGKPHMTLDCPVERLFLPLNSFLDRNSLQKVRRCVIMIK